MSSSSLPFQPSCPSGGTFFSCTTGSRFVGCCAETNPCDSTGCASGNLKPASFLAGAYGTFPDQECPTGSLWYTCAGTKPPFLGCCKANACGAGCGDINLAAAFLSSNPSIAGPFLGTSASSSASAASATTSFATTASVPSATTSLAGTKTSTDIGAIAGGTAAGGVAFVAILLFLFFFFNRRRNAAPAAAATAAASVLPSSHETTPPSTNQVASNMQHITSNHRNTHPALRHLGPTAMADAEGVGRSIPETEQIPMGQQKLGAYESYQTPPPAFPTYTLINSFPHQRPPPPSYIINEIDGTPSLPFPSASPASTHSPFSSPLRAYSSELPSPETDARAEMEGDSPAKRMKSVKRADMWASK